MPELTEVILTPSEERLGVQSPTPPPQGPRQPSAFKQAIAALVDRFQQLLAGVTPLVKSNPWIARGAGIGLTAAVALGAWYLHHVRPTVPPSPPVAKIVKPQATSHKPQATSHKAQANRAPTNPQAAPQAAKIAKLQILARGAFKKTNYALPVPASAIGYSKRVLALDPSNSSSRALLEKSVSGGKDQVQGALKRKDFAKAHRVSNAMAQLLPGRKDIAQLQRHVRAAEGAATKPRPKAAVATVSFTAYHLHSDKAPANHGPYCSGILSVVGHHLKYSGQSASPGQKVHNLDVACSDVREIKKNAHVASHQGGFHVRTASATMNFAPRDGSLAHVSALASACSK